MGFQLKTGFIETSAINFFCKEIDGYQANKFLEQKRLIPIVGMDTIYELGRCFLVDTNKAQGLFNFLNQLNPVYACTRGVIVKSGVQH